MTSDEKKTKILVVQSQAVTSGTLVNQLTQLGYEVAVFTDADESALKWVEEERPDLVLTDIVLDAEIKGTAAALVRKSWAVPVVFLSSHAAPEFLERAKTASPFGYLVEQVEGMDLQSTIETALHMGRVDAERRATLLRLKDSEETHRALFENMMNGLAYCRMLYEDGKPADFVYLQVNEAFEAQTGLKGVVGRKASEVIPGVREADPELFERYGRVALTGRPEKFEIFLKSLDTWFRVSAYSPKPDHFAAVFDVITDRINAEEKLRRSEALLDQTQMITKSGGWEYDVERQTIAWTVGTYRIYEVSPDEYDPNNISSDISFYQEPQVIENAFWRAVQHGEEYDLELQFKTAKGKYLWVRTIGKVEQKDGKVARVFGNIVDITGRKKSELALAKAAERRRVLFEQAQDGIYVLNEAGRVIDVNESFAHMLGLSQEEILGFPLLNWVQDSALGEETGADNEPQTDRRMYHTELRRADGSCFQAEIRSNQAECNGQKVSFHFCRDVTAARRAEKSIKESEELFRRIVENIPDVIVLYDRDLRIRYINSATRALTGRPESDFIGKHEEEIWSPEVYQNYLPALVKTLETGDITSLESELSLPEMGLKNLIITCVPLFDENGAVREILGVTRDLTESRRVVNALKRAELRYRTLFEEAPAMYVITRAQTGAPIIEDCNGLFLATMGRTRGEVLGRPLADFYTPESRYQMLEGGGYQAALSGQLQETERDLVTADGRVIHCLLRAMPETDELGQVVGTRAMFVNITKRKRTEQALSKSEQRYRDLVENANSAIIRWSADGTITFFNDYAQKLFGYPAKEAIGRHISIIVPEKDSTGFDLSQLVQSIVEHPEKHVHNINENVCSDGRRVWCAWTNKARLDDQGRVREILAIGTDITHLKQAEDELRKLSKAIDQSPSSVMITDVKGNIEYVNQKFTEITGFSRGEVMGRNPRILKSGETTPHEYRVLWETITAGREWQGLFHNKKKDGTLFWERATIAPLRDSSGNITHFLGLKKDITTEKSLETQLLHAQKIEAVARLAGGVAHDFNNMLTAIIGNAQMAETELEPTHPIRNHLNEILNAANRSARLTSQLLAFARKQDIQPRVLDLNEAVSGMLKMLRRLIGEDIELVWKPGAGLWPIKMDPAQVDQILANLVVNSRDAISGVGALVIETNKQVCDDSFAEARQGFHPGDYVILSVSDTGHGMDRELIEHIFEPFFTTKTEGRGTGLGLATVYGIVKQNNGFINVYSEPGQGTTFKIYLPRTKASMEDADLAEIKIVATGQETVLLVEDEVNVLSLCRKLLEKLGYTVLAASSPSEALKLNSSYQGPIHLLVTDVIMPQLNGKELRDTIAQERPEIKTLFMSGHTAEVISNRGVVDVDSVFIHKPFTMQEMSQKVRAALDG